jgi:hypothetical protein
LILDTLKQKALKYTCENNLRLLEFKVCELFTYAIISDENKTFTGVTLTPKNEGALKKVNPSSIEEILNTKNYDVTIRAITLATINAVGQHKLSKNLPVLKPNLRVELPKLILQNSTSEDKIVFIGHLEPVVNKLKENARDVSVFCRMKVEPENKIYNDIFEYEAVNDASIVVITGASLIGSTIDALLKFTSKAKMVVIAGFSAGAYPKWFNNIGVTHVVSTYLENFSKETIKQNKLEDVFENPCYVFDIKR